MEDTISFLPRSPCLLASRQALDLRNENVFPLTARKVRIQRRALIYDVTMYLDRPYPIHYSLASHRKKEILPPYD